MATNENLKEAFAGESQANRKYLAYAKKAKSEGYPEIAKLFRAAAEAETVHALAHLRVTGDVRSTQENLDDAMKGASYERYTYLRAIFTCELQMHPCADNFYDTI